ncbi:MAG: hypothetical protein KUG77_05465 [Nannocystaceae bacterium]|nr:hypothetical protein [Nannocystaceae bacterium]
MDNRRFLLSLLVLPACEPAVSSDDDPQTPDGGNPAKFQSSCKAFYEGYYACYEDYDGYASSGSYETGSYETGAYEPGEYTDYVCRESEMYAAEYGTHCVGALEEIFACMSSLNCDELIGSDSDGVGVFPQACRAVIVDASERCPEMVSQCTGIGVGFDGCEIEVSGCIDGNTYGVDCDPGGAATRSCACERNGEVTREVLLGGELECFDEGFLDEVADACGFPAGVF